MRRLSLLIGSFIVGCGLVSACGSDTSTPSGAAGAGGAGGSGGAASSCVGYYADLSPAAFTAAVIPGLGCSASSDTSLICAHDVTTITGGCGQNCFTAHFGDNAAIKSCTADCINTKLPSALSATCSDCYTTDVICTATNCATQCLPDPAGTACTNCRVQFNCAPDFYVCSGLPVPGMPIGAAGATN
jgi:hypothetical protein